jgi:uncharacterized OsmC-like protein
LQNVRVISGIEPFSSRIRIGGQEILTFAGEARTFENGVRPLDLVLASIGGCTVASVQRIACTQGLRLDGVYVELAIHGEFPFQAVGRRIWLDGDLAKSDLQMLGSAADQSPVCRLLGSSLEITSRVMRFPRPDRPTL